MAIAFVVGAFTLTCVPILGIKIFYWLFGD